MARKSKLSGVVITPSNDRRHISKIRFGKISHEIFCRNPKRRKELGLPSLRTDL